MNKNQVKKVNIFRFWINLQLHGVIITTLTLEFMCLKSYEISYKSFFITDITKLFSCFVIALILVEKNLLSKNTSSLTFENFKYEKKWLFFLLKKILIKEFGGFSWKILQLSLVHENGNLVQIPIQQIKWKDVNQI